MKKSLFTVTLLVGFLFLNFCAQKESPSRFSYSPENPHPGDEIIVQYNPAGTDLEKASEISLIGYAYTKGLPEAKEVSMKKEEKTWSASFATDQAARGIIIKFKDEEITDNNNKKGYIITLYGKDGKQIPGGLAGLAEAYSSWGRNFVDMERDAGLALAYFEEEFKLHPELKREYLSPYLNLIGSLKRAEGIEVIIKELDELGMEKGLSEDELALMVNWFTRLKQPEKAQRYTQMIQELYPKGTFIQNKRFGTFHETKDIEKKIALLNSFKNDFPESEKISLMHLYICLAYRDQGNYGKAKRHLEENPKAANWSIYNNIAWDMAEKNIKLELAEEFASKGVELSREERENPKDKKPSYMTDREWKKQREIALGMALDTHGYILLKLNKAEGALLSLEESVLLFQKKNPEINERYIEALIKNNSSEKAIAEIEQFIKDGSSTSKMKDFYKQAFLEQDRTEAEAVEKLEKLAEAQREKSRARLRKEMIDLPAPAFSLEDLEGHTVSLADLKGKVVILDFWATWCGPCLNSFPGMKIEVEKYKDDETVQFFFINSWERVKDWKKNASDFIAKTNYPFHVLLDTENNAIEAYQVDGIPTKFIIDKNGKIRFKSVGFLGSTDKMVEELTLMIEMLR